MEGPDGHSSPSGSGFGATVDGVPGKPIANPQDLAFRWIAAPRYKNCAQLNRFYAADKRTIFSARTI